MKALARWWRAWVLLLDRREPGDALAIVRIATGLCALYTLLDVVRHGLVRVVWMGPEHGGQALQHGTLLTRWLGGPTPGVVWGLVSVAIAGASCVALGLGGRLAPLVTLQAFLALHRLNDPASGSPDLLLDNALWLLVLSRSTATLSLDCLLRTKRLRSDEPVPAFPRYLGVLQLVVLYAGSGLSKLSIYWLPMGGFSALYYILQQPSWQRGDMTWLASVYPLSQIATAVTWLWEVTTPLLLLVFWARATADRGGRLRRLLNRFDLRVLWVSVGLVMHALILAFMEVGVFSPLSIALYACLFRPEELRAAGRRLARLLRVAPPPAVR